VRSAQHSRIPIFEGSIDEIVGILYVKDLMPAVLADDEPTGGWPSLMRSPVFIPASKRIADLLREFRQARRHIAMVADEYGGTAGIVRTTPTPQAAPRAGGSRRSNGRRIP